MPCHAMQHLPPLCSACPNQHAFTQCHAHHCPTPPHYLTTLPAMPVYPDSGQGHCNSPSMPAHARLAEMPGCCPGGGLPAQAGGETCLPCPSHGCASLPFTGGTLTEHWEGKGEGTRGQDGEKGRHLNLTDPSSTYHTSKLENGQGETCHLITCLCLLPYLMPKSFAMPCSAMPWGGWEHLPALCWMVELLKLCVCSACRAVTAGRQTPACLPTPRKFEITCTHFEGRLPHTLCLPGSTYIYAVLHVTKTPAR